MTTKRTTPRPEGPTTKAIEQQTVKIPSDTFLTAAGGTVALSLLLKMMGRHEAANFVGHWTPTILCLGIYNKIVKRFGSE